VRCQRREGLVTVGLPSRADDITTKPESDCRRVQVAVWAQ
jgi:hypothetical protein